MSEALLWGRNLTVVIPWVLAKGTRGHTLVCGAPLTEYHGLGNKETKVQFLLDFPQLPNVIMGSHLVFCASGPAGKGLIKYPGFEWTYLLVYLLVHQGVLEGVLGFVKCCLNKIQKCSGYILEEFLLTRGR